MESKEPGTVRPNFGPKFKEKEIERGFTRFNHDDNAL
jgi:hypothetical protein